MNQNEMRDWLNYHNAAFPGYLAWMKKAEHGDSQTIRDRMSLWAARVAKIDQQAARLATEALHKKENETAATEKLFFGNHLGWICDHASRQKPEREPFSHICRLCNGTGIVSVKFFHNRKTFGGNPLPDNVGQAACQCSEGKHLNECREKCWHDNKANSGGKLEPFDARKMAIHEYAADVGRYEIAQRHEKAGRLKLAKLIEEFGYEPAKAVQQKRG